MVQKRRVQSPDSDEGDNKGKEEDHTPKHPQAYPPPDPEWVRHWGFEHPELKRGKHGKGMKKKHNEVCSTL